MGAFVNHQFSGGFLMDEERLRKVSEIINSRAKDLANSDLTFYLYRADSFFYTTNNIQEIINEENYQWKKIEQLKISCGSHYPLGVIPFPVERLAADAESVNNQSSPQEVNEEDSQSKDQKQGENRHSEDYQYFRCMLDFNRKPDSYSDEGVNLEIEGDNRDLVYLLSSDLKQYISSEVAIMNDVSKKGLIWITNIFLLLLFISPSYAYHLWAVRRGYYKTSVDMTLKSQDVQEKLNFLIERTTNILPPVFIGLLLMTFAIAVIFIVNERGGVRKLVDYFFPMHAFLFGKEMVQYNRRMNLKKNIFWVIIVGSVISLITGFAIWKFTK